MGKRYTSDRKVNKPNLPSSIKSFTLLKKTQEERGPLWLLPAENGARFHREKQSAQWGRRHRPGLQATSPSWSLGGPGENPWHHGNLGLACLAAIDSATCFTHPVPLAPLVTTEKSKISCSCSILQTENRSTGQTWWPMLIILEI